MFKLDVSQYIPVSVRIAASTPGAYSKMASELFGLDTTDEKAILSAIGMKVAEQYLESKKLAAGLEALKDLGR